ncbi:MAG: hypothetical protein ACR2HG_13170 [Pyrinomonadaceae bacterium]
MKNRIVKIFLFFSLLLFVSIMGAAQTNSKNELPRGTVIEQVVCQKDASQSYALYLPTNYAPEKKWAILYAFDPFGSGKSPVEIFRDAAEKFGFIVVGSNNSRNNIGGEKLTKIITDLWADTHARFSIDEKRSYAVGLSGGARVANYFAISCRNCLAGVIACGATFPPKFPLDKPLPYALFGTVGVDDFNFPEMVKAFENLNETDSTNHLAVFDGKHQWLTKDLTFDAIEWLDLQAMKSGRMATDKKFVEDLLAKQTGKAETLSQTGDNLEAARIYEGIVTDFKDAADTKNAAEKLSEIRGQKSYKKSLDEEKDLFGRQQRTAKKIMAMGAELLDAPNENAALKRISNEVEDWRQKSKAAADSPERRLARRILDQVFVETYETALYVNRPEKDYKMMSANLELTRLVNPQNSIVLLELARAFALANRKKDALNAVGEAVAKGLKDCARIIGSPEFTSLRGEKQFQKIIEQLNCSNEGT